MTTQQKAEEAFRLLSGLLDILESQQEKNWIRGIKGTGWYLLDENGQVSAAGFDRARSSFNSMTSGGRGFYEYYIDADTVEERIEANRELDRLRNELLRVFNG
jgi:hypothetical protein